LNIRG